MDKMRVVRIQKPNGPLELVEVDIPEPRRGEVRIKVEACGICHSDSLTVLNVFPGIAYPRTPGHEVAGTIDVSGAEVLEWEPGQRVGVGWHGGHCGHCQSCRRGDFITCRSLQIPGISYDGGYADYMIAPVQALARIPNGVASEEAGPLMCAGITTYNALRNSGARPGDLVGILGLGGLGHLGVQFSVKMGFETVAIARGKDKEPLARSLGAHHYIDSEAENPAEALQKLGGGRVILATVTSAKAMSAVMGGLGVDGKLVVVGASAEPLELNTFPMLGKRQSVQAWPSGTSADSGDTLAFSALVGIRPMIETLPLEKAAEAYERMMSGKARFRMVLSTTSL